MPNLLAFNLLAEHAPYQLYRFAMDWERQPREGAVDRWEKTQEGSLQGVLNGYAYVIPIIQSGKPFTVEDIINIHIECATNVSNIHSYPGELRKGYNVAFGVTPETCSIAGLKELVEEHKEYPYQLPFLSTIDGDEAKISELTTLLTSEERGFNFYSYDGSSPLGELTDSEKKQFKLLSEESAETLGADYVDIKMEYHKRLKEEIQAILDWLYSELETAKDKDEKLLIIVKAVQRLERTHPFADCNCRTLCMVFLNALLMQQAFSPTLMDNPNKFDGYAILELVDLIKVGFKRTKNLVKYSHPTHHRGLSFSGFSNLLTSSSAWMVVPDSQQDKLASYAKNLTNVLKNIGSELRQDFMPD